LAVEAVLANQQLLVALRLSTVYNSTRPTAYFHTISKDAGYDPLIQHLRAKEDLCALGVYDF
jgi:hypothetical protein